jgi:hypothetical protein
LTNRWQLMNDEESKCDMQKPVVLLSKHREAWARWGQTPNLDVPMIPSG